MKRLWKLGVCVGLLVGAGTLGVRAGIPEQTLPLEAKQPVVALAWLTAAAGPQDLGRLDPLAAEAVTALRGQPGCEMAHALTGIAVDLAQSAGAGDFRPADFSVVIASRWETAERLTAYESSDAHEAMEAKLRTAGVNVRHEVQWYQRVAGGIELGATGEPVYLGSETVRAPVATAPIMTIARLEVPQAAFEGAMEGPGGPPVEIGELQALLQEFAQELVKDPGLLHLEAMTNDEGGVMRNWLVAWWKDRRALMEFYASAKHRKVADWLLLQGGAAEEGNATPVAAIHFAIEVYQRVGSR